MIHKKYPLANKKDSGAFFLRNLEDNTHTYRSTLFHTLPHSPLLSPIRAHLPPTPRLHTGSFPLLKRYYPNHPTFPNLTITPRLFKNTPFFTNVLGHIQNSCSVGVDGPAVSSPVAARTKAGVGPHRDHRSGIDTDGLDTGLAVSFEGTAAELTGRVYGTTHHVQAFARHHTRGR